jgi:DNA-binding transcriptional ArsR family regulator
MNIFTVIADPTRRRMLELLAEGELAAGDLASAFPKASQPLISAHLRTLREAKLVKVRPEAQRRIYSLRPQGLREVDRWIARYRRFWTGSFDKLDAYIAELKTKEAPDER